MESFSAFEKELKQVPERTIEQLDKLPQSVGGTHDLENLPWEFNKSYENNGGIEGKDHIDFGNDSYDEAEPSESGSQNITFTGLNPDERSRTLKEIAKLEAEAKNSESLSKIYLNRGLIQDAARDASWAADSWKKAQDLKRKL
jgi:hypothetical protein